MRPNSTQIWTGLVLLGVLLFWSTRWDVVISPTALLLTGADVIKVDPARPKVEQPIAFPHLTHTEKIGLECKFCHRTVETETFATIPGVSTCIICHSTKITDNPEEEKIREYARNGEEIPWVQLNKMPPHVYFSHRRHVTAGRLACVNCMGPMGEQEKPPTEPLKRLTMEFCLNCHRKVGATQDCLLCHK